MPFFGAGDIVFSTPKPKVIKFIYVAEKGKRRPGVYYIGCIIFYMTYLT